MATKKVGAKWFVVKKGGKLGTRGYTSQANAAKAQARGRALSRGSSATSKSPGSSTPVSPPAGGVRARTTEKLGVLWRKMRTLLNIAAPGLGAIQASPRGSMDVAMREALQRYSGYELASQTFDSHHMYPTYQGIAISVVNDWFDRKTRKSAKISRGKIVHIGSELIPALQAHFDARHTGDYFWTFLDSYNKHTDGYSLKTHTWDFGRVELYAGAKAIAYGYDKLVPTSVKRTLNSILPKGVNPF